MTLPDTPFNISPEKAQEALVNAKDGGDSEPLTDSGKCLIVDAHSRPRGLLLSMFLIENKIVVLSVDKWHFISLTN